MDWVPNAKHLEFIGRGGSGGKDGFANAPLNQQQIAELKRAYDLFSPVTKENMVELLNSQGLLVDSMEELEDILELVPSLKLVNDFHWEDVKMLVQSRVVELMQRGRYYGKFMICPITNQVMLFSLYTNKDIPFCIRQLC